MEKLSTVINDPVHGHIELNSLYVKIIDTPQFQRLRFLHQCGTAHFVYPGANHSRYEHCIGVCHLAESMCKALQFKQPELNITDSDVKCVAIAGLCHDLGHGPFSHIFDGSFIPNFDDDWKHEYGSITMFDYLIKDNHLEKYFTPEDLTFIKELIHPHSFRKGEKWPHKGRGSEKSFLYDIVANKKNGMDVDKWDYIVRDCYFMGITTAFDHKRLIKFMSVLEIDNERHICTRDKEVDNIYELFHSRTRLYRQAYLHKTNLIVGYMISEALKLANDFVFIEGENRKKYKMSEAIYDMTAFMKLTDHIFHAILYSSDDNLKPAKNWLNRILCRQLPKSVGALKCEDNLMTSDMVRKEIIEWSQQFSENLDPSDIIIIKSKWDYGMNSEDPINYMWFFSKESPTVPYRHHQISKTSFMPKKFKEVQFLVFCSEANSGKYNVISKCLKAMCGKYVNESIK